MLLILLQDSLGDIDDMEDDYDDEDFDDYDDEDFGEYPEEFDEDYDPYH